MLGQLSLRSVWTLTVVGLVCLPSSAQAPRQTAQKNPSKKSAAAAKSLCVDVVSFRQGMPAKGLIIGSPSGISGKSGKTRAESILMAVERDVLSHDNSTLYENAAKVERKAALRAWEELQQRLQKELDGGTAEPVLKAFYQSELERATSALDELRTSADQPLSTRFMWLELTAQEYSNVKRATPDAQRVAVWAWSEELQDVTTRDRADLLRELAGMNIDATLSPPDLSKQLAPRVQSDDEWAARLALVRYTLGRGLDFQGSAGVYLPAGDRAGAVAIAPLIEAMMSGNLESLLKELDPGSANDTSGQAQRDWFSELIPRVEAQQRSEFRVTRLDPDPTGLTATVETALIAKLPSQGWHIVWSTKHTVRASEVSAEAERQIAEDPQVKTALSLLSALGAGAEGEVKKAIRFGAATTAAQKTVESQFAQFRDRYVQRLNGPPL